MFNFVNVKTLVEKVVVTFVEGALAAWAVTGFKLDKVVLGAVVAGGGSAVYNLVKQYKQGL